MQHVLEDAFLKTPRVATLERRHLRRHRTRLPRVVILLLKQQIYLARRAAQRRLLRQDRKRLHLLKIRRQQHVRHARRLAQIVAEIRHELFPVLTISRRDLVAREVGALVVVRRHAKVNRHLFQPVALQLARRDVVQLHQQIGVDHRPPRQIATRKIHPALRNLQPAVAKLRLLPEASPRARDLVALRAQAQIIQIELKNIVPLDDVRIELGQRRVELLQQGFLRRVGLLREHQHPVHPAATQPDRQHAILRLRRVAERPVGRARLDVQLTPPHPPKSQPLEQPPPCLQQPLAL